MDEGTDDDNSYWATNSSTSIFYDISNSNNVSNSNNGTDTAPSSSSTGIPATQNDAAVLRATFVVYGSFLAVTFLIFCVVRRAYPRAYQLRNWVPHIKTPIAENQFGFFSWMWQLSAVTEDQILTECGLDALCELRLLLMGYRICLLSIFNAIWLMPLYATAPPDSITQTIVDPIVRVTVAHVAAGSKRLIGTVLAAYILFGYVMYQILKEFEWFMEKRHKYLKQPVVENYSVYVRNVPVEYRSNTALHNYFAHCLSSSCAVLDAKLRLKVPTPLLKAVKQRNTLVAKLEHAINFEEIKGRAPMHRQERKFTMSILSSRERSLVPSIPTYTAELRQANRTVTELLESLENNISLLPMSRAQRELGVDDDDGTTNHNSSLVDLDDANSIGMERDAAKENEVADTLSSHSAKRLDQKTVENIMSNNIDRDSSNNDNFVNQSVGLLATKSLSATRTISTSAAKIVQSTKEGEFFSAGFVTFNTLSNTHSIRQMVHHNKPFEIEVMEAPRPEDIFWTNVGRTHKDLQLGKLSSLAATAALCFLWTIPMTFVASLSSVEALSSKIEFLGDLIDRFPFLGRFLGVLAPLLVKFINGLLPTILTYLTLLEGPVSSSVVVASLFSKLATFMIVQTFFVSAVGSSVMNEIEKLLDDPESIIDILAESLPSQSTYFIQIVFVSTAISTGFEILRVMPLIMAFIRLFLHPNLTEKERQTTVFGMFRPLSDPDDFGHAANLAQIVLNFIIMLVYAVIAPLTVFIQAFCFLLMMICYKHQFIYIYPSHPDSGGKIWTNFVSVLLPCLLIAEFTIVGFLALKKSAVASPMMIPLVVSTVLFNAYIRQQHFRVAEYLPLRECVKMDMENGHDFDLSFIKDAYLQDELSEKIKVPDNLPDEGAEEVGLLDS